ncbi:putative trans-zeatin O-beta-D-glucosyltransferase [Helianthus annuus]|uniref:Glycosyltransferase n=1 Tax=Helianthus annuus TaxID=4232 RepID=A0A9K3H0E4_HELAN|nr:zeatin O-glucosyltransferase-like [Helianthus annuus]KAF5761893.1 putative trans-zeatin O-beta-D-glucosyltransferase [Helianthus annuus]KAJ0439663.1 putative trans-zeatin O-beta-D-glucosyltransferase [Helianthus annuus]KAJ0444823.1 putative trans-zeatin O-beta-D-glucosyltransferase [Helianthus annuus]KAJ0462051.1 putative trans-zeatin O-beta-D-glucosyltransferase [Helianthus annuus]KAJ0642446.1 putative trans-zeatin O-beta-D-glucosyltransferase [Helianthus annuus]
MPGDEPTFPAANVAVVMVPMVAHGHLTQLYHLSHLISTYNLPIHFITTTDCLHQLHSRHRTTTAKNIHFHSFTTPPFTSPPPHPSTPFPTHLQPSINSTLHLRHPTTTLIRHLSQHVKKVVVIHDFLMSYVVQDVKLIPNAETYLFHPLPAFYRSSTHSEKTGRPFPVEPELMKNLPSQDGISSPEFLNFLALQKPHMNHVGELYDSSRVIESVFFEYLEKEEKKKIWAVGPFNPVHIASNATDLINRHRCLQWLDKQPANSVIYVSFGTTTTFSDDQVRELALGLERSGQRFVWVVRVADTGDSVGFEERKVELPEGFEERVMRGRGLIERLWAPQLEILEHFATGGFMSHCGWNSCMESISMGVPIVAWPMHSDQPRNAFLITDILRIGVLVKNWERRNELVKANVVAKAVKTLMGSEEGEEMRRRAVKLGGEVKESVAEGGVSRREMDSFISHICSAMMLAL